VVNRGFFWQQQQQKITGLFQGNTVNDIEPAPNQGKRVESLEKPKELKMASN